MAMRSITTADLQLQAAICSGGRWWSHAGRPHDDPLAISAPFSCSSADPNSGSAITAGGHFNWAACHGAPVDAMVAAEPVRACEVWPGSNSTTTYQDFEYAGGAYGSMAMAEVLDVNNLQVLDCELSSPTIFNWSRPFLSTPRADDETGVHGVIQEDMYSSRTYCQQESDQMHNKIRSTNTVHLLEDHRALSSSTDWDSVLFPASAAHEQVDESLQPSFVETPQLTTAKQPSQQGQFTDGDTLFWNPSGTEACSIQMHHSELTHELLQNNIKVNSVSKKCSSTSLEDSEPALKKPRIQTPSPLPTFKVRKEKLGDRITALQQLVSPFGKTDTASVLHEAIDYIKFLHDQVQVLSSSNSKANIQMQQAIKRVRTSEDLRSRGLCLVPISSTIQMVARETPVDFWPLGFGAAPS